MQRILTYVCVASTTTSARVRAKGFITPNAQPVIARGFSLAAIQFVPRLRSNLIDWAFVVTHAPESKRNELDYHVASLLVMTGWQGFEG